MNPVPPGQIHSPEALNIPEDEFELAQFFLIAILDETVGMTLWIEVLKEYRQSIGLDGYESCLGSSFEEIERKVKRLQEKITKHRRFAHRAVKDLLFHVEETLQYKSHYRDMVHKKIPNDAALVDKTLDTIKKPLDNILGFARKVNDIFNVLNNVESPRENPRDSTSQQPISNQGSIQNGPQSTSTNTREILQGALLPKSRQNSPQERITLTARRKGNKAGTLTSTNNSQPSTSTGIPIYSPEIRTNNVDYDNNGPGPSSSGMNGTGEISSKRSAAQKANEKLFTKPLNIQQNNTSKVEDKNKRIPKDEKISEQEETEWKEFWQNIEQQDNDIASRFSDDTSAEEKLTQLHRGGEQFIAILRAQWNTIYEKSNVQVIICENDLEFNQKFEEFGWSVLYLIKEFNRQSFGLDVADVNFENLGDYVGLDTARTFYSAQRDNVDVSVRYFQKQRELRDHNEPFEVLSLVSFEVSKHTKIKFKLPDFVEKMSVVSKIRKMAEQIKNSRSGKSKKVKKLLRLLPLVEKYFIISMKDSFMDIHIDMSATAVFYHVLIGRKVFYIAEPTQKNVKLYKEWEKSEKQGSWLVGQLEGGIKKIVIEQGQVAILKPGTLHFVYTPDDSIVFGGNFLTTESLKLSFDITNNELTCVNLKKLLPQNTFGNFFNTWFFYIDMCFTTGSKIAEEEATIETLYNGLKEQIPNSPDTKKWYTEQQKVDLLNRLAKSISLDVPDLLVPENAVVEKKKRKKELTALSREASRNEKEEEKNNEDNVQNKAVHADGEEIMQDVMQVEEEEEVHQETVPENIQNDEMES